MALRRAMLRAIVVASIASLCHAQLSHVRVDLSSCPGPLAPSAAAHVVTHVYSDLVRDVRLALVDVLHFDGESIRAAMRLAHTLSLAWTEVRVLATLANASKDARPAALRTLHCTSAHSNASSCADALLSVLREESTASPSLMDAGLARLVDPFGVAAHVTDASYELAQDVLAQARGIVYALLGMHEDEAPELMSLSDLMGVGLELHPYSSSPGVANVSIALASHEGAISLRCERNLLPLRYPLMLLGGALLMISAEAIAATTMLYYGSGFMVGGLLSIVLLAVLLFRNRFNRTAWTTAGAVTVLSTMDSVRVWLGGGAAGGSVSVTATVLRFMHDHFGMMVLGYVFLAGAAVVTYMYLSRSAENERLHSYVALILRGIGGLMIVAAMPPWQLKALAIFLLIGHTHVAAIVGFGFGLLLRSAQAVCCVLETVLSVVPCCWPVCLCMRSTFPGCFCRRKEAEVADLVPEDAAEAPPGLQEPEPPRDAGRRPAYAQRAQDGGVPFLTPQPPMGKRPYREYDAGRAYTDPQPRWNNDAGSLARNDSGFSTADDAASIGAAWGGSAVPEDFDQSRATFSAGSQWHTPSAASDRWRSAPGTDYSYRSGPPRRTTPHQQQNVGSGSKRHGPSSVYSHRDTSRYEDDYDDTAAYEDARQRRYRDASVEDHPEDAEEPDEITDDEAMDEDLYDDHGNHHADDDEEEAGEGGEEEEEEPAIRGRARGAKPRVVRAAPAHNRRRKHEEYDEDEDMQKDEEEQEDDEDEHEGEDEEEVEEDDRSRPLHSGDKRGRASAPRSAPVHRKKPRRR